MKDDEYILELRKIRKTFGSLVANDNIDLKIKKGTIHSIVGENGAGKSTLMNIVTCLHKPDSGEIIYKGQKINFKNPMEASKQGIGMVHQEFMLFNDLSVLENIIMGYEGGSNKIFIDKEGCKKNIKEICNQYKFNVPLDVMINNLPVALLQQIEIVKLLYRGADLLILDEPTSVLTPLGIEGLFSALKFLKNIGKTIIFITHKLKEVFAISDYITVLRDGKVSGNILPSEINEAKLASLMVGREVILKAQKLDSVFGEKVLEVKDLSYIDNGSYRLRDINFDLRTGEIVGIAGIAGSGQQKLIETVMGLLKPEKGSRIFLFGENVVEKSIRERRLMGLGYIPQDRMNEGINTLSSIWENAIMGFHIVHGFKSKIFLDRKEVSTFTNQIIDKYSVKVQSIDDKVQSLSGGNIQKLIVGREFLQGYKLLVIEDPTRGLDVGAIEFVWKKIIEIAATGVAILLISHDLNEVMQLSDRIFVMYNGLLKEGGLHGELNENEIGLLMTGGESVYETFLKNKR